MAVTINGTTGITTPDIDSVDATFTGTVVGDNSVPDAIDVNASAPADSLAIDSSGRVTMPNQPAFLVGFGATNTISLNDGDQIQFDNDSAGIAFDNGNNFDTSGGNHSFTAPVTGIYSFNLTVKCSTVGNFSGVLKVNGANANIVDAPVGFSSSNDSCVTTLLIKLNANDYVKAHTRNGNYQLYKGHTFWSGHLIG